MLKVPKRMGWVCCSVGILLSGCSQDQHILERIGYIESVAMDQAPNEKMELTVTVPLVSQFAKDTPTEDELLSAVANTPKEARKKLLKQTSRVLVSGQIRSLLFSDQLAKRGLHKYMDTFMRDPSFSKRTPVVVVEGNAGELISREYPRHTKTSNYIYKLLEKEFSSEGAPPILLHEFIRDLFDDGQDPLATMIREENNGIQTSGIALFRKDRFITKIPLEDIFVFSLLYHSIEKGGFTITTEDPDLKSISFNLPKSKRKIKVSRNRDGEFQADVYVKVRANTVEYLGDLHLSKASDMLKAEQLMSEYTVREAERIVRFMQKNRVDGLGIGKYVRNKMSYSEWEKTDWHEMYSKLPVKVHCTYEIRSVGNYVD